MFKKLFITLEGIEGVGKTTQVNLLFDFFKKIGIDFISTREPGGLPISESIRNILLNKEMSPLTELLLYEAARAEHFDKIISPALNKGQSVICDRFTDASIAYQGYGRGLDIKLIEQLNSIATKGIEPDLTFVIDLPVPLAFKRLNTRRTTPDRFEKLSNDFYEKVRQGYIEQSKKYPKRVFIIDADRTPQEIHKDIVSKIL
ncbi:MAG: dTMP kinase [Proteobacteria bacterium]|nr:dTMP kinase [Pseudomonadota bacterium]